jgi:hypothetical protein
MKININNTKYLNKETELVHKDIVKIASEGAWEASKKFMKEDGVTPTQQFNIELELKNGDVRGTTLNFGNLKLLVSAFGDDTKDWIGNEVRAWKTKSDKATSGYTYVYVPTDWSRNDMGEWEDASGNLIVIETETKKEEPVDTIDYEAEGNHNPDSIPF